MELKKSLDPTEPMCISVTAAAKLLGISRNTGYEMVKMGQLPTIRCGRRRLMVPKVALMKMLEEVDTRHEERKE